MEIFVSPTDPIRIFVSLVSNVVKLTWVHRFSSQCTEDTIQMVQQFLPCRLVNFPFRYLGLPLSVYKLKHSDLQPLVDAVADRLPTWKAGMLSRPGRTAMVKSTLSAILVHISIAVKVSPRVIRDIDKLRRGCIWSGTASTTGGQCMAAWQKVTRAVELGGLGVMDLDALGHALCLRWAWIACTDLSRAWSALPIMTGKVERAMFDASTSVAMGCGSMTWFWRDKWLDGCSIASLAPDLMPTVDKQASRVRTVAQALQDNC
jgi:hypothetical protein